MKRTILTAAVLLGSALNAQADINTWINTAKYPRCNDAVQADARYCEQQVGQDTNGKPTSRRFKQCMAGRGGSSTTRPTSTSPLSAPGSIPTPDRFARI
jgi:hypothetical protein